MYLYFEYPAVLVLPSLLYACTVWSTDASPISEVEESVLLGSFILSWVT